MTLFAARETRDETVSRRVDYAGIAAITVGLTALVLALVEGNTWHWGSTRVIALFAIAVAGAVAFVVIERRVKAPMVDFAFFRSRSFLGASVVGFIVSFAMLAQFFFLALYMQNILHYSPLQAGRPLPALDAGDHRHGPDRRAAHRPHRPAPADDRRAAGGRHGALHPVAAHRPHRLRPAAPGFVLMGVGMGLVMSPMSTAAMNSVDRTKAGVASGVLSMSRMVGGTFGVAVMGALVATIGRSQLDQSLPHVPAATRATIANALGGGGVRRPPRTPQIVAAVRQAFVSALGTGLTDRRRVTLIGAVAAVTLIKRIRPATAPTAATPPARPRPAPPPTGRPSGAGRRLSAGSEPPGRPRPYLRGPARYDPRSRLLDHEGCRKWPSI